MNSIGLVGIVGNDPEIRYSQSGTAVVNLSLAVRRAYKGKDGTDTDWFRVVAFGKTAETIGQYVKKGSWISIEGSMQNDKYTTKEGEKRDGWQVSAQRFSFVGPKVSNENSTQPQQQAQQAQQAQHLPPNHPAHTQQKTQTPSTQHLPPNHPDHASPVDLPSGQFDMDNDDLPF